MSQFVLPAKIMVSRSVFLNIIASHIFSLLSFCPFYAILTCTKVVDFYCERDNEIADLGQAEYCTIFKFHFPLSVRPSQV